MNYIKQENFSEKSKINIKNQNKFINRYKYKRKIIKHCVLFDL